MSLLLFVIAPAAMGFVAWLVINGLPERNQKKDAASSTVVALSQTPPATASVRVEPAAATSPTADPLASVAEAAKKAQAEIQQLPEQFDPDVGQLGLQARRLQESIKKQNQRSQENERLSQLRSKSSPVFDYAISMLVRALDAAIKKKGGNQHVSSTYKGIPENLGIDHPFCLDFATIEVSGNKYWTFYLNLDFSDSLMLKFSILRRPLPPEEEGASVTIIYRINDELSCNASLYNVSDNFNDRFPVAEYKSQIGSGVSNFMSAIIEKHPIEAIVTPPSPPPDTAGGSTAVKSTGGQLHLKVGTIEGLTRPSMLVVPAK